jgi:hypothetical protein
MMKVSIEIDSSKLKQLVIDYISGIVNLSLDEKDLTIEVKTKFNSRAEWEAGDFRASYRSVNFPST